MDRAITPRQQSILDAISSFTAKVGYSPTSGEIAARLGMRNSSTVRDQMVSLRKKGYLDWSGSHKRTLRILTPVKAPRAARGPVSSAIDLGPGPQPNDHERELALSVVQQHRGAGGRTPALLTLIAKTLAVYRLQLRGEAAANG